MMRRTLMKHQREALRFVRQHGGRAGLFMAPGTGKTLVGIRSAIGPALVICRRDDFLTWNDELGMEGVSPGRITQITSGAAPISPNDWTLVTYDLVKSPKVNEYIRTFPFLTVLADESHMVKRWEAKRTKSIIRSTRHIPRRIAMTGSPITNEVLDVFSQSMFIDNGRLFGNSEWRFKNKYYLQSGQGWYPRRKAKDEITRRLEQIAFHVHEDDVLKLPPIRRYKKGVKMSSEQAQAYGDMLEMFEVMFGDGEIVEVNDVLTQVGKLKQIASGFMYREDGTAEHFPCPKIDLLFDLLLNDPFISRKPKVIVWCSFTAEIERIASVANHHGIRCVTFCGSNRKAKNEARRQFKGDPGIRLFIGQVDSGVGMNELAVADTAIYFSNSHKTVSRQQSMRRTRRIGSEHHTSITYLDLLTEDTVDLRVFHNMRTRMNLAQSILDELKHGVPVREILS
jgi:SNF2 family DNA or RNA helicase